MTELPGQEARPRIAVVGATGLVGNQVVELIGQRKLPLEKVRLFASSQGAGSTLDVADAEITVEELSGPADLADSDIVFLCVPEPVAKRIASARPGPILIDLSEGAWDDSEAVRMAPGFTARGTAASAPSCSHIALPHPGALLLANILEALGTPDSGVSAVLMIGASAFGTAELDATVKQSVAALSGTLDLPEDAQQVAFNALPPAEYSELARRLAHQVAALRSCPAALNLSVFRGPLLHGAALLVLFPAPPSSETARERLRSAPLLLLQDAPVSVTDALGADAALANFNLNTAGASVWCAFDAARLAALTALWAAEAVIE